MPEMRLLRLRRNPTAGAVHGQFHWAEQPAARQLQGAPTVSMDLRRCRWAGQPTARQLQWALTFRQILGSFIVRNNLQLSNGKENQSLSGVALRGSVR